MCLAGINCNYKGESKPNEKIKILIRAGKAIPICPEQLGGLPTPRSGSRIISGNGDDIIDGKTKVITDDGKDVTENYLRGAEFTLELCKQFGIKKAILKQGSPSCGKGKTQGGEGERKLVIGNGVTTALLQRNGMKVYNEDDLENEELWNELIGD